MNKTILDRIQALGGDISLVEGKSLADDLCAITFNTVLYKKPVDTPWAGADEEEPIDGLGQFMDENMELYQDDRERFFRKLYEKTEEPYGQYFWNGELFTPFQRGVRILMNGMICFKRISILFRRFFRLQTISRLT